MNEGKLFELSASAAYVVLRMPNAYYLVLEANRHKAHPFFGSRFQRRRPSILPDVPAWEPCSPLSAKLHQTPQSISTRCRDRLGFRLTFERGGVQPLDSKERGLQVLRKSRTRQLTYGSGAEPLRRGLGQHLYNSQSSIEAGKMVMTCDWPEPSTSDLLRPAPECPYRLRPFIHTAKKGRVEGGSQLAASLPCALLRFIFYKKETK
ncbi:hypothetical protein HAX54_007686 [Datura stramonium]|uniref:Uncharacterized protein n=1 Tax=Datura stramonium TaxID=4076 RepID=A0ABS8WWW7_DATST|nr:hypothetical protein [Datura stramonium]